jgi:hypothetical protein
MSEPYRDRATTFRGIREYDDWRLKLYTISYDGTDAGDTFEPAMALARDSLPRPARTNDRPGVGFAIAHRGRGVDYLVLGWWDRENELPLRVFVRPGTASPWRPAQGSESVCVWDLQVIWFEREAYVRHVLADPPRPNLDAYLSAHFAP